MNFFSGEGLQHLPYLIGALIPALTFHEWAHAMTAHLFGDDTPKHLGRLSLNPLAHLDPLGTVAIFLIGFGWAKPVPVNPRNYKSTWGDLWVAAAGPLMNLFLATLFAMALRFGLAEHLSGLRTDVIETLFVASLTLNLALFVFNLIPIGPLDGNYVLARLLPLHASIGFRRWNDQYGSMALLGLILINGITPFKILSLMIGIPTALISRFLVGA